MKTAYRNDFRSASQTAGAKACEIGVMNLFCNGDRLCRHDKRAVRQAEPVSHVTNPFQHFAAVVRIHNKGGFINKVYIYFRRSGILYRRENIVVRSLERFIYGFFAPDSNGLAAYVVEGPDVVKATGMVFMVVCEQYCVQIADACPKQLVPEIRACIDQYP